MLKSARAILIFIMSAPVHIYRFAVSPLIRPSCRHIPSCSQYMLDALKIHGPFTGFLMGADRILRCRPGGTHGFDPVPRFRFKKFRPINRCNKCSRLK